MIKRFFALLIIFMPLTPIHADVDDDIWGLENIDEPAKQPGPFRIECDFDSVAPTHFNKSGYRDQKFGFSQYNGTAGMAFCYIPSAREAYGAGVGYTFAHLCWKENPFFRQTDFNQVSLLLRLFSNRFCDWIWQGQFAANANAEHMNDLGHYLDFDITLWGRYDYCDTVDLHIGFIIQTGMKIDRVYPILGFDWDINKRWTLNMVFPVNISLQYEYSSNWTAALAMRFFDTRYRANKDEPLPMAIVRYLNSGFELAAIYQDDPTLEANVHVGSTLGGMLRISDKDNRNARHFKLDPSLYVGGEVIWSF